MRRVVTVFRAPSDGPSPSADRPAVAGRWLVRFGYDGSQFRGWARQPGAVTVEGEIRRALGREPPSVPSAEVGLEVASRTDRGVSARANALTLSSALSGATLLRRLNGISPWIWFTAATNVPAEFRVRRALRRSYRYFDPNPVRDATLRQEAARLLAGEIDVRSFGRGLAAGPPVRRRVESVSSRPVDGGTVVEVRAPSFVWGMVRKIVAALREVDEGRLSLPRLRDAVEGRVRLSLPLAEPEPLVLWDVEYPVDWAVHWAGPMHHQARARETARSQLWSRQETLKALAFRP